MGNILLLSKVSNHTMPMKQTCYRLDEQIRQAIVLLEAQWSPKQLDFDADLAEVTWCGPETLMLHVWTNLISNAVKFSPQHGLIAVALKQTDGRFEIAITDQGPGIPPEEQERIYRRFYQVDSSHQQRGTGWGWHCVSRFWTTAAAQFAKKINLPAAAGLSSPCRRK